MISFIFSGQEPKAYQSTMSQSSCGLLAALTLVVVLLSGRALAAEDRNLQRSGRSFRMLDYLDEISGRLSVSGIHNRLNADVNWSDMSAWKPTGPSVFTDYITETTGKTPGLWSGDFLFGWPNAAQENRWQMIYEAERQFNSGALVNIMFHTCHPLVGPTEQTSCSWSDFENGPRSSLTDREWESLITDGTDLNNSWKARLDDIAVYLQYLKDRNVDVMFRPLHEMNQGAFWWGGRSGASGTRRLYQITHDYMQSKGLTNLIWVWNVQDLRGFGTDIVSEGSSGYNPGPSYFDVATLDIYQGFDQWKYDVMDGVASATGKPIGIGECKTLPSEAVLANQPKW